VSAARVLYTDPSCPPLRSEHAVSAVRMAVLRERRLRPWPHEPGSDATIHACRAVVAAGLRWPDRQLALLEALQALSGEGAPLDDSDTLELAAARARLPVAEIAAYCAEPEVEAALRADMAACRGREIPSLEIDG
jgi:predicted DsbA family dithiol-disulfide isomerase